MDGCGAGGVAAPGNRDPGPKGRGEKPASAIFRRLTHPHRFVAIVGDHNARIGAQMQVPQHMAGRQRREQHVFGIVFRRIAAQERVVRAMQDRLAGAFEVPGPVIGLVGAGAGAAIAGDALEPGPDGFREGSAIGLRGKREMALRRFQCSRPVVRAEPARHRSHRGVLRSRAR